MTTTEHTTQEAAWYARPGDEVAAELGVDPERGLGAGEVDARLSKYGPNELPKEPPPRTWDVARGQLSNPMNIMLMLSLIHI